VEEAYLIYENGTLIAHRSNKNIPEEVRDDEIISGMFTAVQDFISDGFACMHPGDGSLKKGRFKNKEIVNEWQLNELNLEGHKIMIEHSKNAYLAVIYTGRSGWKLNQLTKLIMKEIDNKYSHVLADWKGNMAKVKGIEYLILPLVDERVEL
jgi:hydroxymethylpyrimidine pyrophosphatase-like HAD family hydrolase